jgi:hypothetical protein
MRWWRWLLGLAIAVAAVGVAIRACRSTPPSTQEARGRVGSNFQFLFSLPGYDVERLRDGSDLFSDWGTVVFVRTPGPLRSVAVIQRSLLRAAQSAGFRKVEFDELDLPAPTSERWTADASIARLAISRVMGRYTDRRYPTSHECRIWITSDGSRYAASYRTDTH